MARGKKNLTLDQQLEKITKEISDMENSLKAMKQTKKELEEQIHINQVSELNELIKSSDKSIEEVKEFLGVSKEKEKAKK